MTRECVLAIAANLAVLIYYKYLAAVFGLLRFDPSHRHRFRRSGAAA